MHNPVLSLGRTFGKSSGGHLGRRPRAGALLVASLFASGVVQLSSSPVAATGLGTQDPSVTEVGLRAPIATLTPAGSRAATRPRLAVDNDTVFEGDDARFELRLSKSSRRWVTVHFFTEDGSARGGSDYEELAGSRSLRPGSRFASVSVETFKDRRREGDETFFLHVFRVRGATLVDSVGRATILDRRAFPPCHPRCNPPCHPRCPPPCHPNCPPPCQPNCPPPCQPNCPPPCQPNCPPPCQPNCPPPCQPNCPPPCQPNCPPPCQPNCPPPCQPNCPPPCQPNCPPPCQPNCPPPCEPNCPPPCQPNCPPPCEPNCPPPGPPNPPPCEPNCPPPGPPVHPGQPPATRL